MGRQPLPPTQVSSRQARTFRIMLKLWPSMAILMMPHLIIFPASKLSPASTAISSHCYRLPRAPQHHTMDNNTFGRYNSSGLTNLSAQGTLLIYNAQTAISTPSHYGSQSPWTSQHSHQYKIMTSHTTLNLILVDNTLKWTFLQKCGMTFYVGWHLTLNRIIFGLKYPKMHFH